jgi:ATP-dependent DNA helicase PIF1
MDNLNKKQREVLDFILKNPTKNVFLTGCAGVGKTHLVKVIIEEMKKVYNENQVYVTAMTGLASLNFDNGMTLHSFAGCGIDGLKQPNPERLGRWRKTRTLFVDEISMLGIDYFENIYKYLKTTRLIFIGDFLQLPPVNSQYCFESLRWADLNFKTFKLTDIVRQSDPEFIKALNELRINEVSKETIMYLNQFEKPAFDPNATKLYAVNRGVDIENTKRLEELNSTLIELKSVDATTRSKYASGVQKEAEKVLKSMLDKDIPDKIKMKIGAYVMLTRNDLDKRFVNGSMGVISGFSRAGNPLIVLNNTEEANKEEFTDKVKNKEEEKDPIEFNDITEEINDIDKQFMVKSTEKGKTCYIDPVEFSKRNAIEIERVSFDANYKGYKMIRSQYPLKLAWALTIHKSQGLTLNSLNLNINGTFEKGQCYTGISRVKSPDKLVINDVENLLLCNRVSPEAMEFWNAIE